MNSIKRTTTPVFRKYRAIGKIWLSFTPLSTTVLTFTGDRPAAAAA
jgi:hypothetical protein